MQNENNIEKLKQFEKDFIEFNHHTNLISKNDEKVFFEKHVIDSLAIEKFFQKYNINSNKLNLLDIGTGGGLPALPISICYPSIKLFAVDSIKKKINFINKMKEKYQLENLSPLCERIEKLPVGLRSSFDVSTSRALAKLNILLEYAVPFLKVGGYFVAYKSKTAKEEIKEAQNALKILNAEVIDIIEYSLNEEFERNLIVVKKIKECIKIYPRQNGLIKKSPL